MDKVDGLSNTACREHLIKLVLVLERDIFSSNKTEMLQL